MKQELSQIEKSIDTETRNLVMLLKNTLMSDILRDTDTGIIYRIENYRNIKQSDYAKDNDRKFAQICKKNGLDIFKYTCHASTLKSVILNEVLTNDEFGNTVLPEWIVPFIEMSEYKTIKIK